MENYFSTFKSSSTKEKIIHETIRVSLRPGLNDISLGEIAKASEISKTAIFRHFKNKEELLNETLKYCLSELLNFYMQESVNEKGTSKELIQKTIRWMSTHTDIVSYILRAMMINPEIEKNIVTYLASTGVKLFKDIIPGNEIKSLYLAMSFINFSFYRMACENQKINTLVDIDTYSELIAEYIFNGIDEKGVIEEKRFEIIDEQIKTDINDVVEQDRFFVAIASVIQQFGFTGVTIEKIANELGMAKSSIYTWFKNKEELVKETIYKEFINFTKIINENVAKTSDTAEKAYIIMRVALQLFLDNQPVFLVSGWLHAKGEMYIPSEQKEELSLFNIGRIFKIPEVGFPEKSSPDIAWMISMPLSLIVLGKKNSFSNEEFVKNLRYIHNLMWGGLEDKKDSEV